MKGKLENMPGLLIMELGSESLLHEKKVYLNIGVL